MQKNAQYRQCWFHIFRHDYISKLWLPLHQPSLLVYHQSQDSLIPPWVLVALKKQASKEMCFYCGHDIMSEIKSEAAKKTNQTVLKVYALIGNHEINILWGEFSLDWRGKVGGFVTFSWKLKPSFVLCILYVTECNLYGSRYSHIRTQFPHFTTWTKFGLF